MNVFLLAVLASVAQGPAHAGERCAALGIAPLGRDTVSVLAIAESPASFNDQQIRVVGTLDIGFESDRICQQGIALEGSSSADCLRLFFDWDAFGGDREDARRVLR